jgi:hypothetical protein
LFDDASKIRLSSLVPVAFGGRSGTIADRSGDLS